jgi:predicted dehydrogenase
MKKVGIGLYGTNGHQIQDALKAHAAAELVAVAAFDESKIPEPLRARPDLKRYATLDEMLKDPRVELVSLCSPRRRDQARDAVRCLDAGKHVYAEKPCAMTEADLDQILQTARRTGLKFHEMAGTAFEQPYREMRQLVQEGVLGTVVQVLAQKSYPCGTWRPQDEDVDAGLLMQVGIHALRFVEHVACVPIASIEAVETGLGNPGQGDLKRAVSMMAVLENGGVASIVANYLNFPGFGSWGNESLRIFGTQGFVEAVDGGKRTLLMLDGKKVGELTCREKTRDYLDFFLDELRGQGAMPLSIEDELHPVRMAVRAKASARAHQARR